MKDVKRKHDEEDSDDSAPRQHITYHDANLDFEYLDDEEWDSSDGEDCGFCAPVDLELKVNAYSLLLVRLVGMWNHECASHVVQIMHGFLVYFAVIAMQMSVSAFLLLSTDRLEHPLTNIHFTERYKMTLEEATTSLLYAVEVGNHSSLPESIYAPHGGVLQEVCSHQLKVKYPQFYYVMTFVWLMVMMAEIKETVWFAIGLAGVPRKREETQELIHYDDRGHNTRITCLTCWQKAVVFLLFPVVRTFVIVVVTLAGCEFLVLQERMFTVIIKTLCMRFVVTIDSLAMASLASNGAVRKLRATKMKTRWGQPREGSSWDSGVGGLVYFIIILCTLLYVMQVHFHSLMNFRRACWLYHNTFGIVGVTHKHGFHTMLRDMFSVLAHGT